MTDKQRGINELQHATIEDLRGQIIGDPNCHKHGCYGKGFIGLEIDPSGVPLIKLCVCARLQKNDFIFLKELMDTIRAEQRAQFQAILRHTFFGGLKVFWNKLFGGKEKE